MKLKHVMWILAGLVAVVTMAAGVAVLLNHYMGRKSENMGYIECECDPEEELGV